MKPSLKKFTALFILAAFVNTCVAPPGYVQAQITPSAMNLPLPGTMVKISDPFLPPTLEGVRVHPDDPFRFDFLVDTGDATLSGPDLDTETAKLVKYFLATLTVPEEDLWVNLSPYEHNRIIPEEFGTTEMGRDMLAQDYVLKQLMASLLYPEQDLGRKFWEKVYKKAHDLYGTTNIPVDTFNKVWIMPGQAVVYEDAGTALILKSHLTVMLDEDYLAVKNHVPTKAGSAPGSDTAQSRQMREASRQVIREVILPALEKEVNEGEHFAPLRQIYHAMILAAWYKQNLKNTLLSRLYIDQKKIKGVDVDDKEVKDKIYQQYLEAFRRGVYNYIREDYDPHTATSVPRKYFSGGFTALPLTHAGGPGETPVLKVFRPGDSLPEGVSSPLSRLADNVNDNDSRYQLKTVALAAPGQDASLIRAYFQTITDAPQEGVDGVNISESSPRVSSPVFPLAPPVPREMFDETRAVDLRRYVTAMRLRMGRKDDAQILAAMDDPARLRQIVEETAAGHADANVEAEMNRQAPREHAPLEIISNAADAQMTLQTLIGRFGRGAWQIFRFLIDEDSPALADGNHITIDTLAENGKPRRVFFFTGADHRVKFMILPGLEPGTPAGGQVKPKITRGTILRVQFARQDPAFRQELEDFLRGRLKLFDRMPLFINGKLVNPLDDYAYLNGAQVQYLEPSARVQVRIGDDFFEAEDHGTGINDGILMRDFLVDKSGNKPLATEQTPEEIAREVHLFYKAPDYSGEEHSARLHFQVAGIIIESAEAAGVDLPEELAIQLPASSKLTAKRDTIEINDTTYTAVEALAGKIIRTAPAAPAHQIALMNAFMAAVRALDQHNARMTGRPPLADVVKTVFHPYISGLYARGKVLLPNTLFFRQLRIADDPNTLFLDEALLYKLTPNMIPGSRDINEAFQPGRVKQAYTVPFKHGSRATYVEMGPYLLLNEEFYEKKKNTPRLINDLILNFYPGYGPPKEPLGWILGEEEQSARRAQRAREQEFLEAIDDFPELRQVLMGETAPQARALLQRELGDAERLAERGITPDLLRRFYARIETIISALPEDLRVLARWDGLLRWEFLRFWDQNPKYRQDVAAYDVPAVTPDTDFLSRNANYFRNTDHPERLSRYLSNILTAPRALAFLRDQATLQSLLSQLLAELADGTELEDINDAVLEYTAEVMGEKNLEQWEEAFGGINQGMPYMRSPEAGRRLILQWLRLYAHNPEALPEFEERLSREHERKPPVPTEAEEEKAAWSVTGLRIRETRERLSNNLNFSGYTKNGKALMLKREWSHELVSFRTGFSVYDEETGKVEEMTVTDGPGPFFYELAFAGEDPAGGAVFFLGRIKTGDPWRYLLRFTVDMENHQIAFVSEQERSGRQDSEADIELTGWTTDDGKMIFVRKSWAGLPVPSSLSLQLVIWDDISSDLKPLASGDIRIPVSHGEWSGYRTYFSEHNGRRFMAIGSDFNRGGSPRIIEQTAGRLKELTVSNGDDFKNRWFRDIKLLDRDEKNGTLFFIAREPGLTPSKGPGETLLMVFNPASGQLTIEPLTGVQDSLYSIHVLRRGARPVVIMTREITPGPDAVTALGVYEIDLREHRAELLNEYRDLGDEQDSYRFMDMGFDEGAATFYIRGRHPGEETRHYFYYFPSLKSPLSQTAAETKPALKSGADFVKAPRFLYDRMGTTDEHLTFSGVRDEAGRPLLVSVRENSDKTEILLLSWAEGPGGAAAMSLAAGPILTLPPSAAALPPDGQAFFDTGVTNARGERIVLFRQIEDNKQPGTIGMNIYLYVLGLGPDQQMKVLDKRPVGLLTDAFQIGSFQFGAVIPEEDNKWKIIYSYSRASSGQDTVIIDGSLKFDGRNGYWLSGGAAGNFYSKSKDVVDDRRMSGRVLGAAPDGRAIFVRTLYTPLTTDGPNFYSKFEIFLLGTEGSTPSRILDFGKRIGEGYMEVKMFKLSDTRYVFFVGRPNFPGDPGNQIVVYDFPAEGPEQGQQVAGFPSPYSSFEFLDASDERGRPLFLTRDRSGTHLVALDVDGKSVDRLGSWQLDSSKWPGADTADQLQEFRELRYDPESRILLAVLASTILPEDGNRRQLFIDLSPLFQPAEGETGKAAAGPDLTAEARLMTYWNDTTDNHLTFSGVTDRDDQPLFLYTRPVDGSDGSLMAGTEILVSYSLKSNGNRISFSALNLPPGIGAQPPGNDSSQVFFDTGVTNAAGERVIIFSQVERIAPISENQVFVYYALGLNPNTRTLREINRQRIHFGGRGYVLDSLHFQPVRQTSEDILVVPYSYRRSSGNKQFVYLKSGTIDPQKGEITAFLTTDHIESSVNDLDGEVKPQFLGGRQLMSQVIGTDPEGEMIYFMGAYTPNNDPYGLDRYDEGVGIYTLVNDKPQLIFATKEIPDGNKVKTFKLSETRYAFIVSGFNVNGWSNSEIRVYDFTPEGTQRWTLVKEFNPQLYGDYELVAAGTAGERPLFLASRTGLTDHLDLAAMNLADGTMEPLLSWDGTAWESEMSVQGKWSPAFRGMQYLPKSQTLLLELSLNWNREDPERSRLFIDMSSVIPRFTGPGAAAEVPSAAPAPPLPLFRSGWQASARDPREDLSGFPPTTVALIRWLTDKDVALIGEGHVDPRPAGWELLHTLDTPVSWAELNYLFIEYSQELQRRGHDLTFPEFLAMAAAVRGTDVDHLRKSLLSEIEGQGQNAWLREVGVQNPRDAVRDARRKGLVGPEKGEVRIRNFTENGRWIVLMQDDGTGMDIFRLAFNFFPMDNSSKDSRVDTGNMGKGNKTLPKNADTGFLRTSLRDSGLVIEADMDFRGGPLGDPMVNAIRVYRGDYAGTEVRREKDAAASDPQLESFFLQMSLSEFASAVPSPEDRRARGEPVEDGDVRMTYNGETYYEPVETVESASLPGPWGEIGVGRSENRAQSRVLQDDIMVKDRPDKKELRLVPSVLRTAFEQFGGLHIIISRNIKLDIDRSGYVDEHKFLPALQASVFHTMARAVLADFDDPAKRGAYVPGMPPDYMERRGGKDDDAAIGLAKRLNAGRYDQIRPEELEPYLKDPLLLFELMSHLDFTSRQDQRVKSLHDIRENLMNRSDVRPAREGAAPRTRSWEEMFGPSGGERQGGLAETVREAAGTDVFTSGGNIGGYLQTLSQGLAAPAERTEDAWASLPEGAREYSDYLLARILLPTGQGFPIRLHYENRPFYPPLAWGGANGITINLGSSLRDQLRGALSLSHDKAALARSLRTSGIGDESNPLTEIINIEAHERNHLSDREPPGGHTHHHQDIPGFEDKEDILFFRRMLRTLEDIVWSLSDDPAEDFAPDASERARVTAEFERLGREPWPGPEGSSSPLASPAAAAGRSARTAPGGIDFNPQHLDLEIRRDRRGVPLPVEQQPLDQIHIEGLVPVIIQTIPVHNMTMLLGRVREGRSPEPAGKE